ncbi:MAG: class I SAM-dependent methyltransferase [Acidimicrobiales bacterium]|nr:class I SAM-dependent methyltransferase [Acidimicrobiales bacterium]
MGADPAAASLEVARAKPEAWRVQWFLGDAAHLPEVGADLVTMTGNVAQVFVSDADWSAAVLGCRACLRPGGRWVFETRDPSAQAWRSWTRTETLRRHDVTGVGKVHTWVECTQVDLPRVSFESHFVFEADGHEELVATSTIRFRGRDEVVTDLAAAGLAVEDVRDAPDRPGLEFVFVARAP